MPEWWEGSSIRCNFIFPYIQSFLHNGFIAHYWNEVLYNHSWYDFKEEMLGLSLSFRHTKQKPSVKELKLGDRCSQIN